RPQTSGGGTDGGRRPIVGCASELLSILIPPRRTRRSPQRSTRSWPGCRIDCGSRLPSTFLRGRPRRKWGRGSGSPVVPLAAGGGGVGRRGVAIPVAILVAALERSAVASAMVPVELAAAAVHAGVSTGRGSVVAGRAGEVATALGTSKWPIQAALVIGVVVT